MMKPLVIQGRRGLFQLSDPRPVLTRSQTSMDRLTDRWSMDYHDDLSEGQSHPKHPGLILRQFAAEEDVPALITADSRTPGIYLADCEWEGAYDNDKPEKIIGTSETRLLKPQWETFTEGRLSYHAMPKAITGTASTDVIDCPAHGLTDGRRVAFLDLTGGAGLTGQSTSALATPYYVISATADTLQVSTTEGGAAVNFSTNITAGYLVPVEYLPGSAHPTLPQMFLDNVSLKRTAEDVWHQADCTYIGQRTPRPYHRIITVNGQTVSSSVPIQILLTGGWTDYLYTNFSLPRIVVTDTYVTTSAPATGDFPAFATPPNAPSVMSLTFTGTDFIFNYPYGWTLQASDTIDTLSSGITLNIVRNVYEFVWPALLK
jgi:hypothetical protein